MIAKGHEAPALAQIRLLVRICRSCVVILQLLFLGYLGAAEWKRREDRREATRMQQGPANFRLSQVYAGGQRSRC